MGKKKIKKKVSKWLEENKKFQGDNDGYGPNKFGESKSVEFEIDGLVKSFCKVTEWSNGEGFDISFETETNTNTGDWKNSRISVHADELECLFACLDDLNYFGK